MGFRWLFCGVCASSLVSRVISWHLVGFCMLLCGFVRISFTVYDFVLLYLVGFLCNLGSISSDVKIVLQVSVTSCDFVWFC